MIGYKGVGELEIVIDDEMTFLLHFMPVFPADKGPPELRDDAMIAIPALKIEGTPGTNFLGPESAYTLKGITSQIERLVGAFETFVVLLYFLQKG